MITAFLGNSRKDPSSPSSKHVAPPVPQIVSKDCMLAWNSAISYCFIISPIVVSFALKSLKSLGDTTQSEIVSNGGRDDSRLLGGGGT